MVKQCNIIYLNNTPLTLFTGVGTSGYGCHLDDGYDGCHPGYGCHPSSSCGDDGCPSCDGGDDDGYPSCGDGACAS